MKRRACTSVAVTVGKEGWNPMLAFEQCKARAWDVQGQRSTHIGRFLLTRVAGQPAKLDGAPSCAPIE
jgi:hypothetical protein